MTETLCPTCGHPVAFDGLIVDRDSGALAWRGKVVKLTRTEFTFFQALWSKRPQTLPRARLMVLVYGREDYVPDDRYADVMISKVRAKCRGLPFTIKTAWGFGYQLVETAP